MACRWLFSLSLTNTTSVSGISPPEWRWVIRVWLLSSQNPSKDHITPAGWLPHFSWMRQPNAQVSGQRRDSPHPIYCGALQVFFIWVWTVSTYINKQKPWPVTFGTKTEWRWPVMSPALQKAQADVIMCLDVWLWLCLCRSVCHTKAWNSHLLSQNLSSQICILIVKQERVRH